MFVVSILVTDVSFNFDFQAAATRSLARGTNFDAVISMPREVG